jgi:long-subunit fatty acid transport protein
MKLKSKLAASVAVLGLGSTMAVAEGLERVNLDTSFMYENGSYAELSMGSVNPSVPATLGSGLKIDNVAKRFTVSNFAAKTQISENIDVGLWSTNQAMGVGLDWAPIGISADLTGSALVGLVRYTMSENISIMGGLKRVQTKSGASVSTPISALSIASSTYTIGSGNVTTGVYGVAYQRPEMALRVELLMESEGEMTIDTTYSHSNSGGTQTGKSKIGLGDAITLNFQSGIAPNTLLFGSIRNSRWQNNQVSVPLTGMPVSSATFNIWGWPIL